MSEKSDAVSMESRRRSKRATKGVPPYRFGEPSYSQQPGNPNPARASQVRMSIERHEDSKSRSSQSSKVSSTTRRRMELELKAVEDLAKITEEAEKSKLEAEKSRLEAEAAAANLTRQKEVILKKLEIAQAELDEEDDARSLSVESNVSQNLQDEDLDGRANTPSNAIVQDWLMNTPQQDTYLSNPGSPLGASTALKSFQSMTQALTEAISKGVKSAQPDKSDGQVTKFMARQSIAKDLPTFNGAPEEWPTFISQYRRSTLACGFTPDENVARLLKSLRGKARETVEAMLTVPENVDAAIQDLEARFGRPDKVVEVMIERAKKVPEIKSGNMESIIDVSNAVKNLVQTMKHLNCTGHLTNPHLLKQLTSKLPDHLQLQWGLVVASKTPSQPDLEQFSCWLKTIADAISYLPSRETKDEKPRASTSGAKKKGNRASQKDTVLQTTGEEKLCSGCEKSGHAISQCRKLSQMELDARWKLVKEKKLCFCCLKPSHSVRACKGRKQCGIDECQRFHHQLLHSTEVPKTEEKVPESVVPASHTTLSTSTRSHYLLRVIPVKLYGPKGIIKIQALLDEGSTISLLDATVAKKLGLKGTKSPLNIKWLDSTSKTDGSSQVVSLQISGQNEQERFNLKGVRTVSQLKLPCQPIDITTLSAKWPVIAEVGIQPQVAMEPLLLLGQDQSRLIASREMREGPSKMPLLSRTNLGWCLHGDSGVGNLDSQTHFSLNIYNEDDDLHAIVKRIFSTEAFGVQVVKTPLLSKEEQRARELMDTHSRQIGPKWETCLLWKTDEVQLPESKAIALRALRGIEKKMDRDENFATQYCEKIEDYLAKGYARTVPADELGITKKNLVSSTFCCTKS